MKFLFDFFPVVLFFTAYKVADIYVATGVAIVATIAQIAWLRYSTGKIEPMQWLSLGIIVVFGGATILAHDETFIKWKPTVLYWLFAVVLAGSALLRRNLIRSVLSQEMQLPEPIWRRLNWAWVGFFAFMGVVNLYVAFNYSEKVWATFKLFGGMGLMFLFVVAQSLILARYMQDEQQ